MLGAALDGTEPLAFLHWGWTNQAVDGRRHAKRAQWTEAPGRRTCSFLLADPNRNILKIHENVRTTCRHFR